MPHSSTQTLLGFRTVSKNEFAMEKEYENQNQHPCVIIKQGEKEAIGIRITLATKLNNRPTDQIYRNCKFHNSLYGIHTDEYTKKGILVCASAV